MFKRLHPLTGALLSYLVGCGLVPVATQAQPADEVESPQRFEVLVVGTIHAPWQFRSRAFTPAHVRAVLQIAEPDVIGVESNPTWFAEGKFHEVTYEAQGVALPFGKAKGIPVYGIDFMDIAAWDRRQRDDERRMKEQIESALVRGPLPLAMFGRMLPDYLEKAKEFFENPENDFELVNQVRNDDYAKQWLRGDPSQPDFGGRRNQEIVANCVKVMEQHKGKRLVVVIGAGHKAVLDLLFARTDGVRVLKLGKDLPTPTAAQVDAAWTAQDLIVTLGHNLDGERSYFHPELVDLPRMKTLLKKLASDEGREDVCRYFRSRIHAMEGDLKNAERELDQLIGKPVDAPLYPFPMHHWRMQYSFAQAVRIEKARILAARGETDEAARVLKDIPAEVSSRLEKASGVPVDTGVEVALVKDPGFELGKLADSPINGWYCHDVAAEEVRVFPEERIKVEGARSLCVEILKERESGRPSVCQAIPLPKEAREEPGLEFSIFLRGEEVAQASLVAGVFDDQEKRMETLARDPVTLASGEWCKAAVKVEIPREAERLHVFVYFSGEPGAKIWFDGATPLTATAPSVPAGWKYLTFAREFPRTLLAEARQE